MALKKHGQRIFYGFVMLWSMAACNLVSDESLREPTADGSSTEIALTQAAASAADAPTSIPGMIDVFPTDSGALVPNVVLTPISPAAATGRTTITPAIAVPQSGGTGICAVYTVYSGTNPDNTLSLRQTPSVDALQLLRLPNFISVYLVPNSQEVEADGYHWLNVIYIDALQNRTEGWAARDSYEVGGVRDPSVATLRPTGQQTAC